MISLKEIAQIWNRFFYEEKSNLPVSIYRIFIGIFLFANFASIAQDFPIWFGISNESMIPLEASYTFYGDFRINLFKLFPPTLAYTIAIFAVYLLSSLTLTIGYFSRTSALIAFLCIVSIHNRNFLILNSGDTVQRCMMLWLIFAPCGNQLSIDSLLAKRRGRPLAKSSPVTFTRLMQLQFSIVYLSTAFFKFKGTDWVNGTAIYYSSRLQSFQRVMLPFVFDNYYSIKLLTWGTLFIEFSMGTLVWIKEFRLWVLLCVLILHIGIEITMSIGYFELIMIGSLILFLEEKEIKSALSIFKRAKLRTEDSQKEIAVVKEFSV